MNPFDKFDQSAAEANPFDQFEASPPPQAPKAKRSIYGEVAGAMANVNRGLGIGDELAAGGATVVNALTGKGPQGWTANMAAQRELEDGYAADRPKVAAFSRGTGNALTAAVPAGETLSLAAAAPRAVNALRGATTAALTGAGYAAADRGSLNERVDAATDPVSMGVNALLGGIGGGFAPTRGRLREERAPAPTLEDLRIAKSDAYDQVDQSGVTYTADAFKGLVGDITEAVAGARLNAKLHPKAAAMLDYLSDLAHQAAGFSPSLTELDELRQVVGRDVSSASDEGERRMGQIIRGKIDDFIDAADGGAITGGDPEAAAQTIKSARDLNTRIKKLEALDGLDLSAEERAATSGTGANIDNTTRQNVRRFKDSTTNLTPAEEAAARKVVMGTPGQNALRAVGRLSPEGGAVPAVASLVTGAVSKGAIPAVGFASRRIADAITARNVKELRDLIASGGEIAQEVKRQLSAPEAADLRKEVAARLAVTAGAFGSAAMAPTPTEIEIDRSTDPEHLAWRREHGLQ